MEEIIEQIRRGEVCAPILQELLQDENGRPLRPKVAFWNHASWLYFVLMIITIIYFFSTLMTMIFGANLYF